MDIKKKIYYMYDTVVTRAYLRWFNSHLMLNLVHVDEDPAHEGDEGIEFGHLKVHVVVDGGEDDVLVEGSGAGEEVRGFLGGLGGLGVRGGLYI